MKATKKIFSIIALAIITLSSFANNNIEKADASADKGNTKVALHFYRKALNNAKKAEINTIVFKMAETYMNAGQYKRAEAQYRRLIRRNFNNPVAFLKLGVCLTKNNKLEEAAKALNTYASLNPSDVNGKVALQTLATVKEMTANAAGFQVAFASSRTNLNNFASVNNIEVNKAQDSAFAYNK